MGSKIPKTGIEPNHSGYYLPNEYFGSFIGQIAAYYLTYGRNINQSIYLKFVSKLGLTLITARRFRIRMKIVF